MGRPAGVARRGRRDPRRGRRVDAVAGGRARLGRGHQVVVVVGSTPPGATGPGAHRPPPRRPAHRRRAARRDPRPADHLHRRQRHRPDGTGDGARPAPRGRPAGGRPRRPAPVRGRPQCPGRDLRPQRGAGLAGRTPTGARRRPAGRAGPARRPPRPRGAHRTDRAPAGREPRRHPARHRGGLPRRRPGRRGHGAHADRAPEHGALPAGRHHQDRSATTSPTPTTRRPCAPRSPSTGSVPPRGPRPRP